MENIQPGLSNIPIPEIKPRGKKIKIVALAGALFIIVLAVGWFSINNDYLTAIFSRNTLAVGLAKEMPINSVAVAGQQNADFANLVFDGTRSSEDIKLISVEVQQRVDRAASVSDVTQMQLWYDSAALNTGVNVVNPGGKPTSALTRQWVFKLDSPLIIPKGTKKILKLRGNVSSSALENSTQQWGLKPGAKIKAVSVSSERTVRTAVIATAITGQIVKIVGNGQLSFSLDSKSPSNRLLTGNTTGNIMTVARFRAVSEQIIVRRITLGLTSVDSVGVDVAQIYIYDGPTLMGQSTFPNRAGGNPLTTGATTIITLDSPLVLPADSEKVVTIKADIAEIKTANTIATSGHKIVIDVIGAEGTGMTSGTRIIASGSTNSNFGVLRKSIPSVSLVNLTNKLANGGPLYRFRVSADSKGDIELYKFTLKMSGNVKVSNLALYNMSAGNKLLYLSSSTVDFNREKDVVLVSPNIIPAGSFQEFELRGNVSGISSASFVATQLLGDSGSINANSLTASQAEASADNNFIWSDFSAANHGVNTFDWTNGYLVPGLPPGGLASQTLTG